MKVLSRADEILLLAILRLKEDAYAVTIVKEVEERTGKTLTFGSLWVSLDVLYKRGLVDKRMDDPSAKRGGRPRIYYSLTPAGVETLEKVSEFQKEIWKGVPRLIKDWGSAP